MSSEQESAAVRRQADELEEQLRGHLFLGGCKPSKADVEVFHRLLGADNVALHRWLRHIVSFTPAERNAWPATSS